MRRVLITPRAEFTLLTCSGEAGGFLYYVMPYVEGESLREKLVKEGELPVSDAVRILKEVGDTVGAERLVVWTDTESRSRSFWNMLCLMQPPTFLQRARIYEGLG